ncbi:MAG: DUF342 domain-containing protein [Candidatus Lambdaproteobacteria bacterium]|nr:DUF342 domain-containing protein [Candidatus Lambdaproteobacteria bacterium]
MASEALFELKVGATQVLLRVHPPEQGRKANLSEIQSHLAELKIPYRHEVLFDIYRRANNTFEILAARDTQDYTYEVKVSREGYEAAITVVPPRVEPDDALTTTRIQQALADAKVVRGLLPEAIERIVSDRLLRKAVVVARGEPVVHGQDGTITFLEPEDAQVTPEPGQRIDIRELNLVKSVAPGDIVARITPPTEGKDGFTVQGKDVKAKNGRPAKYRVGKNVALDEHGAAIVAQAPGFLVVAEGRVSVENVLQVENVDGSTGNLHFRGVVRVRGNVEDGFLVESDDGIDVDGAVGKAQLKTNGGIRVHGGALGATLEAGASVSARFLSECTVRAKESVNVEEYILHSTVEAGRSVRVLKVPNGFINGGTIRAGVEVHSPNLGSNVSEERTEIEVGVGLSVRQELEALEERMQRGQLNFDKLRKNLQVLQVQRERGGAVPTDRESAFAKMIAAVRAVRQELLDGALRRQALIEAISSQPDEQGVVLVPNVVNAGTRIRIRRFRANVKSPLEACAFHIVNNEMKVQDIGTVLKLLKQGGQKPTA